MRTLLIDNYDSFTFNLFHLLGEVNGDEPIVVRNDELTWEEIDALRVDNIVISPGPGALSTSATSACRLMRSCARRCRCSVSASATRRSRTSAAARSSMHPR